MGEVGDVDYTTEDAVRDIMHLFPYPVSPVDKQLRRICDALVDAASDREWAR